MARREQRCGVFAETLGSMQSTLILDEVDALVPGKKDFRGKRHGKWMDKGMHPAEAVVKLLAKRSTRDDFQMIARARRRSTRALGARSASC